MKLHNTLTRSTEEIIPLENKTIRLYTCGLTVYSQPHIGNWVAYIYWDILVRTLKLSGYEVIRVQNITDVGHLTSDEDSGEDKMEKGARAENITAWDVAEKYIAIAEHEAYDLLGLMRPDHMPRATEYIPQQVAFVAELSSRGFTYEIPGDGIYFDTGKLKDYGKLAQLDIAGLQSGARIENSNKKNPTDFAVWKFSPAGSTRDMEWESPWGKGFPGWHLECSVMAREILGDQIDIHTGGIDHIPVHHTNEIAQTEAVTDKTFSTYWVHANHIKVDGTKMSKSIGNIYTLQNILDKGYDLDAFKLLVLGKHYTTEGNFTWDNVEAAQNRLTGFKALADLQFQPGAYEFNRVADNYFDECKQSLLSAVADDLNVPQALLAINETIDYINQYAGGGIHEQNLGAFTDYLQFIDSLLGLHLSGRLDITEDQKLLLESRRFARNDKEWQKSDEMRSQLLTQGIQVNDKVADNGQPYQIWSRL